METTGIDRRALTGASLALALPVIAACGADDPEEATDPAPTEDPSTPQGSDPPTRKSQQDTSSEAPSGIADAADVPVGGGIVLADQKLVITHPTSGDFKGFTAVCTHQGCLVDEVTDTINCPCHGSIYSIEDGSVVDGPAPAPLAEQQLVVDSGAIILA
jgi:Rieske Fe-S protein